MTDTPLYLSPITSPLADEKLAEKLLKLTKKGARCCTRTRMAGPPTGHTPAAAKAKFLKRGVKEVVKGIRKGDKGCADSLAAPCRGRNHRGRRPLQLPERACQPFRYPWAARLVILAGNVSPIDVITHIPVMCEEADIPYIYVPAKVRPRPRCPGSHADGAQGRPPLHPAPPPRAGCPGRGRLHQAADQCGHGHHQGRV